MFQLPPEKDLAFVSLESNVTPALDSAEEALVAKVTNKKTRTAFALGRGAAREALKILSGGAPAIGRQQNGAPQWPPGFVGSISHTERGERVVAIAATGRTERFLSIGLDIEDLERPLSDAAVGKICRPAELSWVQSIPTLAGKRAMFIFSAKEAFYKALAPLYSGPMNFQDAELAYREEAGVFDAWVSDRVPQALGAAGPSRILVYECDGFVMTAVLLRR